MTEYPATTNLDRARAYLRAIENRVSEDQLAGFFSPEVLHTQYPNRLVPKIVQSTLSDMMRESQRGKKSVSRQTYNVTNAVASGDWVALQVEWEGILAVPLATLAAGDAMRAWFAVFLEFRDGKIIRQSNYDCFEPW